MALPERYGNFGVSDYQFTQILAEDFFAAGSVGRGFGMASEVLVLNDLQKLISNYFFAQIPARHSGSDHIWSAVPKAGDTTCSAPLRKGVRSCP
ncbi:hypothetical protein MINTM020_01170 [Mycobacterium paraintracellulare]|nr:hypothetical protein MINTM020_01170 [Mycobacterium paraintracellulare]